MKTLHRIDVGALSMGGYLCAFTLADAAGGGWWWAVAGGALVCAYAEGSVRGVLSR